MGLSLRRSCENAAACTRRAGRFVGQQSRKLALAALAGVATVCVTAGNVLATDPPDLIPDIVDIDTLVSEAGTKVGTVMVSVIGVCVAMYIAWAVVRKIRRAVNS